MSVTVQFIHHTNLTVRFLVLVIKHFLKNNGLLLAGAIAYYTLLSIIPALVLMLLVLSNIIDQERLYTTLHDYLILLSPDTADAVLNQVKHVMIIPELAGSIGIISMLIFSGFAFRIVNDAMQIIFLHRHISKKRHTLLSLSIPYVYVFAITVAVGIIVMADTTYAAIKHTVIMQYFSLPARDGQIVSFIAGLLSEAILFMSFYMVMPVGKTPWKLALLGGFCAAILWECIRQFLLMWYNNISNVNMIYGTFASVILLLLMIEAGAVILLLGAQVIADYEQLTPEKKHD